MEWKESPSMFTSATKTVTDLSNNQIHRGTKQLPHLLDIQEESCSNATTSQCIEKRAVAKGS
jgi:hypothetical protein